MANFKKKTHEQFVEETMAIRPNIKIVGKYKGYDTPIEWICENGHDCCSKPYSIRKGQGCYACGYERVSQALMLSQEEIEKRIHNANPNVKVVGEYLGQKEKIKCQCLLCDSYFDLNIVNNIENKPIWCPVCSDGVSYPNKFIRNVLQKLPVENLKYEYQPEWAKPYFYDTYFQYKDKSYIIEMDGGFHYGNEFKINGRKNKTFQEVQAVDYKKDELAFEHDIEMIRIEAKVSEMNYIKENILNSKLAELFDFTDFDWLYCHMKSTKSDVKTVCNLFNEGIDISEIALSVGCCETTAKEYLKKGNEFGWCNYIYRPSPIIVYDKHTLERVNWFRNVSECVETMNKLGKGDFAKGTIGAVCRGSKASYKGYVFRYQNGELSDLPLAITKFR